MAMDKEWSEEKGMALAVVTGGEAFGFDFGRKFAFGERMGCGGEGELGLCFWEKDRTAYTVGTVGQIGAMQCAAVFINRGVKLLYASTFLSLTSCVTLRYDKYCAVLVARRWAAHSDITHFKMGPKMLYFRAGPTMPEMCACV